MRRVIYGLAVFFFGLRCAFAADNAGLTSDEAIKVIAGYKRIIEVSNKNTNLGPLEIYSDVVGPAEKLINVYFPTPGNAGLKEDQKRLIASIYAEKSRLINDNEFYEWPFDNKFEVALASIDKAVSLLSISTNRDELAAEYFYTRGEIAHRRKLLPNRDILAAARRAQQLNPDLLMATWLEGNCLLREAEQFATGKRRELLKNAIAKFDAVADQVEGEERGTVLLDRANGYVRYANHSRHAYSTEALHEILLKAVADATAYLEIDRSDARYRINAFCTLGNAREDLAYIAKTDLEENYKLAEQAFRNAISENPIAPEPYKHLGRCLLKMNDNGIATEEDAVAAAVENLQTATRLFAETESHNSDAYYWLARAMLTKDGYTSNGDQIDRLFARAHELNPANVDALAYRARLAFARGDRLEHDELFAEAVSRLVKAENLKDALVYCIEWVCGEGKVFGVFDRQVPKGVSKSTQAQITQFVELLDAKQIHEEPRRMLDAHVAVARADYEDAAKNMQMVVDARMLDGVNQSMVHSIAVFCKFSAAIDGQRGKALLALLSECAAEAETVQANGDLPPRFDCLMYEVRGRHRMRLGLNGKDAKSLSEAAISFQNAIRLQPESKRWPEWVSYKHLIWVYAKSRNLTLQAPGVFKGKDEAIRELQAARRACRDKSLAGKLERLIPQVRRLNN